MKTDKQNQLAVKIWNVKQAVPQIKKKTKGFKFKYADFQAIESALAPEIKKQGLAYKHSLRVVDGQNIMTTTIFLLDDPDVFEEHTLVVQQGVELAGMNAYQVLGSALTYFRRYHLVVAFGLVTGEDIDAIQSKQEKPKTDHVKKVEQLISIGRGLPTIIKYKETYKAQMSETELKIIEDKIKSLR